MTVAAVAASVALAAPPVVQKGVADTAVPQVQLDSRDSENHILQTGNDNDAYWVDDSSQNPENRTEGPGPDQYEQRIGVDPHVGPHGEVAYRMQWRWPQTTNEDVKTYPSIISGRKPGLYATNNMPRGTNVRLRDGSIALDAPSGATPGTPFPMQLPVPPLTTTFNWAHNSAPTGSGQLVYDLWLQSSPGQASSFQGSPITHEIMIPLDRWGGFGSGWPCYWRSHDVTISGRLFHVYAYRDYAQCPDGVSNNQTPLVANFPPGGTRQWKFVVFVPDVLPMAPGELDLAAFVNHLGSYVDGSGNRWATGNEWLVSNELGVETLYGTGDITVYNYKVARNATPAPNPPTPTTRIQAETGTVSGSGTGVHSDVPGYEGTGYVGSFSNDGDTLTVNTPAMNAGTYDVNIRYHDGGVAQHNIVQIGNGQLRDVTWPATGDGWAVKTLKYVTFTDGVNAVKIKKLWGWMDVDYVEITPSDGSSTSPTPDPPPSTPPPPTRIQAENGTLTGLTVQSDYAGYDGTGYVGAFEDDGDKVSVTFPNVPAGRYDVRIRHLGSYQQNYVDINGAHRSENFPDTGGQWATKTISGVTLAGGATTVAVSKEWGWFYVDYIELVPSTAPSTDTATKKQAENGTMTGAGAFVQTYGTGYEGAGYVGPFSDAGDKVAVSFTGVVAGTYDVRIRYQSNTDMQNYVDVNGARSSVTFPATGSGQWGVKTLSGVALATGTNTVAFAKDWGWMSIDSFEIVRTG